MCCNGFQSVTLHAEIGHRKYLKSGLFQFCGIDAYGIVTQLGCSKLQRYHARVGILTILFSRCLQRKGICEDIVINLTAPLADADRLVWSHDDVVPKYILAISEPHMRMECVVDEDVVLHGAMEAFAQFDSSLQAEIVADAIVRGAIVEVYVPTFAEPNSVTPFCSNSFWKTSNEPKLRLIASNNGDWLLVIGDCSFS